MTAPIIKDYKKQLLDAAVAYLDSQPHPWHSNNANIHIKIKLPSGTIINFWPTAGKWQVQGQKIMQYGLDSLKELLSDLPPPN